MGRVLGTLGFCRPRVSLSRVTGPRYRRPMADEMFDVVDGEDRVVGRAPRREVHAKGLLHRAVHILVFNHAGEVFLQKRSLAKDMAPGLWDSSCSGHLDAGEDYDAAAWRELGEELGLHLPAPPQRWFRVLACEETGMEFVWVYRAASEGPFTLHPDEIECGEWLMPAELTRRVRETPEFFSRAFRFVWGRTGL
jgi:isopentenyl-diphosphate Delta-isomerase